MNLATNHQSLLIIAYVCLKKYSPTGFDIPKLVCASTLGMENGKIPDSAIVASSRHNQHWGPERGRLNEKPEGNSLASVVLTMLAFPLGLSSVPQEKLCCLCHIIDPINQASSAKNCFILATGYVLRLCVILDLDCVLFVKFGPYKFFFLLFHKHKKELGQHTAILTSLIVDNPYITLTLLAFLFSYSIWKMVQSLALMEFLKYADAFIVCAL